MADLVQKKAEQDTLPPTLEINAFRESARAAVDSTMRDIIARAASPKMLVKIGDIPLLHGDIAAADLMPVRGSAAWKAFRDKEDFLIVRFANGRQWALGPAEDFGLTGENLKELGTVMAKYAPGSLPKVEEVIADYKNQEQVESTDGGKEAKRVVAIIIAKPLDCLQFVNASLAPSGARQVKPASGYDLSAALGLQGKAIIQKRENFAVKDESGKKIIDDGKVAEFFQNARTGDVLLFLMDESLRNVADGREAEKLQGDRMIWLDSSGRVVDVSRMKGKEKPGRGYFVGHSGVFSGPDTLGYPTAAQSHICKGNISVDAVTKYLMGPGRSIDAIGVISLDFFMKDTPVAEGQSPFLPDTTFVKIARLTR